MDVPVTEKNLTDLKQNLNKAKETMVRAEATYAEVIKNLDAQKEELKQYGINSIEEIDSHVKELEEQIRVGYAKHNALYEEINLILNK